VVGTLQHCATRNGSGVTKGQRLLEGDVGAVRGHGTFVYLHRCDHMAGSPYHVCR
jgi:hypothetical protein